MTGYRWLTVIAFGLIFAAPAFAAAFDSKTARTTCTAQYEREKEGGTIPAGMAKSKYVTQCINGARRNWQLEQQLAQNTGAAAPATPPAVGSNELQVSTPPAASKKVTSAKPAAVATPAFNLTNGQ